MTIPQVMWLFEKTSIYNSLQHFLVAITGISSMYYIGQSSIINMIINTAHVCIYIKHKLICFGLLQFLRSRVWANSQLAI